MFRYCNYLKRPPSDARLALRRDSAPVPVHTGERGITADEELSRLVIPANPEKHAGDSRLLLDSRYDEKYGRWRSLFFYRSGMTTHRRHSRAPTRYSRDSGNDELGTRESRENIRRQPLLIKGQARGRCPYIERRVI